MIAFASLYHKIVSISILSNIQSLLIDRPSDSRWLALVWHSAEEKMNLYSSPCNEKGSHLETLIKTSAGDQSLTETSGHLDGTNYDYLHQVQGQCDCMCGEAVDPSDTFRIGCLLLRLVIYDCPAVVSKLCLKVMLRFMETANFLSPNSCPGG